MNFIGICCVKGGNQLMLGEELGGGVANPEGMSWSHIILLHHLFSQQECVQNHYNQIHLI